MKGRGGRHARAKISQAFAARPRDKGRRAKLFRKVEVMKAIKRLGKRWETSAGGPIKNAAVDQQAAYHNAMTRQKLCRRMHDQIRTQLNWTTQVGRCERGIDHHRNACGVGNFRDRRNVQDFHTRIAHHLTEDQLGVVLNGRRKSCRVSGINKRRFDAKSWQGIAQQIVGAAVQTARGNNMVTRAHQCGNREMHRGLTTGHSNGSDALVQYRNPFFEHRIGGVRKP